MLRHTLRVFTVSKVGTGTNLMRFQLYSIGLQLYMHPASFVLRVAVHVVVWQMVPRATLTCSWECFNLSLVCSFCSVRKTPCSQHR